MLTGKGLGKVGRIVKLDKSLLQIPKSQISN